MSNAEILSFGGKGQSHGLFHGAGLWGSDWSGSDGIAVTPGGGAFDSASALFDTGAEKGASGRHANVTFTDTLEFNLGNESVTLTLAINNTNHFGAISALSGTAGGFAISPTANFSTSSEFFDGNLADVVVVASFETAQGTYQLVGQGIGSGNYYHHPYDGVFSVIFTSASDGSTTTYSFTDLQDFLGHEPVCYVTGTLILTPEGEVPVEKLRAGSVVVTASGQKRPVKWVGHRKMRCSQHPEPLKIWPVRVAAEAFGPGMPHTDLLVSPGHALRVSVIDDVLMPASALINGSTIARVAMNEVTYWHVELDSHDLLVANGMAAESYLEMGNRQFFAESNQVTLHPQPDAGERTHADMCLPFVKDAEFARFVRTRLHARAERLGWVEDRETDLHLLVDGVRIDPVIQDRAALFTLPASARDARICSTAFCPQDMGGTDKRRLGVSIVGLALQADNGDERAIALDDARLDAGWYWLETGKANNKWRWTKGEAALCASFWQGMQGDVTLRVAYGAKALRGWRAPAVEVRAALAA